MGLVAGSTEHQKLHARRVVTEAVETQRGAKRGTKVFKSTNNEAERGVPLVGAGAGVIKGTRPGDSVYELEKSLREISEHERLTRSERRAIVEAQVLNNQARRIVRSRISSNGVLRNQRFIT